LEQNYQTGGKGLSNISGKRKRAGFFRQIDRKVSHFPANLLFAAFSCVFRRFAVSFRRYRSRPEPPSGDFR
jgi:hypothetical protein